MFTFVVQALQHLFRIGTLVPSSRFLARSMTDSLRRAPSPKRVLEAGPGTGAITQRILPYLNDGDEFYLTEINSTFSKHVETHLLRHYRATHPGVLVDLQCSSIVDALLPGKFDVVICSLPFRAFDVADVESALARLVELTVDHGNLTWMQYAAVRQLKGPFVGRQRRKELCVIDDLCNTLKAHHDGSVDFVLVNLLPSYVVTLTKNGVAATTSPTRVNRSRIAEGAGARFGS